MVCSQVYMTCFKTHEINFCMSCRMNVLQTLHETTLKVNSYVMSPSYLIPTIPCFNAIIDQA